MCVMPFFKSRQEGSDVFADFTVNKKCTTNTRSTIVSRCMQ